LAYYFARVLSAQASRYLVKVCIEEAHFEGLFRKHLRRLAAHLDGDIFDSRWLTRKCASAADSCRAGPAQSHNQPKRNALDG
jgi:hypothetical protein